MFNLFDNFKYKNIVNSGGCGIGLTICHKLCNLLDIELKFESEEGKGTKFNLKMEDKRRNDLI